MILSFGDEAAEDIFHGENTKTARRIPVSIWKTVGRKLDMLNAAHELWDLAVPPGNRLEALRGNWAGRHSIRINDQFRIVFRWKDGNAHGVRITDYH
ncbi:MAG: type II toxin-antitoxin system RelE/ParE family toxin [Candidatus Omnitrophica bacterium]|nr:type II toxin-antitoxin system RelE/ParE family toxin [Candidatus Omnitrophota bacterium]